MMVSVERERLSFHEVRTWIYRLHKRVCTHPVEKRDFPTQSVGEATSCEPECGGGGRYPNTVEAHSLFVFAPWIAPCRDTIPCMHACMGFLSLWIS
jgi:hypothetical protein